MIVLEGLGGILVIHNSSLPVITYPNSVKIRHTMENDGAATAYRTRSTVSVGCSYPRWDYDIKMTTWRLFQHARNFFINFSHTRLKFTDEVGVIRYVRVTMDNIDISRDSRTKRTFKLQLEEVPT